MVLSLASLTLVFLGPYDPPSSFIVGNVDVTFGVVGSGEHGQHNQCRIGAECNCSSLKEATFAR